jgi:hypothetical protein
MAVRSAGGEWREALRDEVTQPLRSIRRMALVMHRGGPALCHAALAVDPPQQQGATVGRQRPAVKSGPDGGPRHGRKTPVFWRSIRQKQPSWGLYGIGDDPTLFYQRLTRGWRVFMNNPG